MVPISAVISWQSMGNGFLSDILFSPIFPGPSFGHVVNREERQMFQISWMQLRVILFHKVNDTMGTDR